jgi:hypothetical protein
MKTPPNLHLIGLCARRLCDGSATVRHLPPTALSINI